MEGGKHSASRRSVLRTVGTGLAVGAIGSVSGCLGQAEPEPEPDSREIEEGQVDVDEIDEEPSSGSSLAGSATGEPNGIERHNMSFWGRYQANDYNPKGVYKDQFIYIFNKGGYVIDIELFYDDIGDGSSPIRDRTVAFGHWLGFPRWGDLRISVVGSNESLLVSPDVQNIEIWMGGAVQTAHYWAGDF